uniref:Uncharacterized protein n=1 Tax=Canis lupus familiaris TaxID=9615 RepID=A0A8C0PIE5_CANLF
MTESGLFLSAVAELTGVGAQGLSPGQGMGPASPSPAPRTPAAHPGAHALQVGGVHGGAQRHGPGLRLLQVVLHLHDIELEVHTPSLLDPALLIDFLQLLLQAGQDPLRHPRAGGAQFQPRHPELGPMLKGWGIPGPASPPSSRPRFARTVGDKPLVTLVSTCPSSALLAG